MTTFSKSLMPLAKNRIKVNSRLGVCIRVSHKNKTGYILTGVDVGCHMVNGKPEPNWVEGMITAKEPEWLQKNAEVERILAQIEKRYEKCINPGLLDCLELCKFLKDQNTKQVSGASLRTAYEEFYNAKIDTVTDNYLSMVRTAIDRLCKWFPGELMLRDITPSLISQYDRYLHMVNKKVQIKGKVVAERTAARKDGITKLSDSQIGKEKTQIKAVLNWCIANGLVQYDSHPFAKVEIPRSDRRDCSTSCDVIKRIRDAYIPEGPIAISRDIFMLSFWMGGMNWSDIRVADWSRDVVTFVRNKTKGRTQNKLTTKLPICDEARKILKHRCNKNGKFVTGWHYTTAQAEIGYVGRNLRKLKDLLKIEGSFSFYSARHTFSQMALECGINDNIVDYIMSHSNGKRGVISYYSSVTPKMAGLAMSRVRDYLENPAKFENEIVAGLLR